MHLFILPRIFQIRVKNDFVTHFKRVALKQGLQIFLLEGHISYYTTVRGRDLLRNVIVSWFVTFYRINKFLVKILCFHYWQNGFAGLIWPVGRSLEASDLDYRTLFGLFAFGSAEKTWDEGNLTFTRKRQVSCSAMYKVFFLCHLADEMLTPHWKNICLEMVTWQVEMVTWQVEMVTWQVFRS